MIFEKDRQRHVRRTVREQAALDAAIDNEGITMNNDAKKSDAKNSDAKNSDAKNNEATQPKNLRANVLPIDGFVLSIDGKLKARYETEAEAVAAGSKLKQSFPVICIAVYDAAARTYMPPLELAEK